MDNKINKEKKELIDYYRKHRYEAHQFLFPHRHKNDPAPYQKELIELLNGGTPLVAVMAFRGAAKSTFIEEYVLLSALFDDTKFTLLVGPKWESACDRLVAIRSELENNDRIIDLFGDQKGEPWSLGELVLRNGVKIQAVGAGQSMRGKKYNAERPDLAIIDDLEDEDSVRTEESRHRTDRWMAGTLRPALNPKVGRIRFLGTPIHPKSLIFTKAKDAQWSSKTFPAIVTDLETGEEKSCWPGRFPIEYLKNLRSEYLNSGNMLEWQQEYMCVSEDVAAKPFQASMIKVAPAESWLPVQMFVDPARTVKASSARTGYAAWSWLGNKLIVHKAEGNFHKPDEIIKTIMQWDEKFKPVRVGIELVGLEEWLGQPLRMACAAEGRSIPWEDIRAPKDKISFIRGSLQPLYIAGDVIHAEHMPDLENELLAFPTGRMDVVNALAYALKMRAGRPVYDDFAARHVAPVLEPRRNLSCYLCVSSRPAMTAGSVVQFDDGILKIYQTWVYSEPPKECFERLLREAALFCGGPVKVLAPVDQFNEWQNTGLPAAIRASGHTATRTSPAKNCEGKLRPWLQGQLRGTSKLIVHQDCRWVINSLAEGYSRRMDKHGHLMDAPADDQYRVVMEAIESMIAWLEQNVTMGEAEGWNYRNVGRGKVISLLP